MLKYQVPSGFYTPLKSPGPVISSSAVQRSPQIESDERPHKSGSGKRDCGGREMIPHQCQGGNKDRLLDSPTAPSDTFQLQFSLQVAANDTLLLQ